MADDLISREAFIEDINTEIMNLYLDGMKGTPRPYDELYDIIDRINEQPAVDAVEVVRCKDCKYREISLDCGGRYCHAWGMLNGASDDGFCNYGERRGTT